MRHKFALVTPKAAGSSELWTPAELSTRLWLDAQDGDTITTSSGAVTDWLDKSGNNHHASQTVTANRPAYEATGFNGLPTLSFDGSNDSLSLVTFAQASGQNIFAVVDTTEIGSNYRVMLQRANPQVANLAIYLGSGLTPSDDSYKPMVYWNSPRSVWSATIRRKAIFRWGSATGSPASALTQVDAATPVTSTFTASALTSWASICDSANQQAKIKVSELIITTSTPSTDDLDRIHGYLAHRWGLASLLPSGHPYKASAPLL